MAHQRSNNAYHQQNDMLEDELSKKTSRLKQIAIKIGDEARFQNEMLSKMDDDFNKTDGFLGSTMLKLKKITGGGYGKMWCTLFLWIMGLSFFMYLILRFK